MSFDLSKFLTEGLIDSVNNGLIPSDLATVYAGNYLVKSLITQAQVNQVSDAITAYKAAQASATAKAQSAADNAFSQAQATGSQADSELAAQSAATVDNNSVQ
ncbi:hypothetical protein ACW9VY_01490 [Lactiplantibacillus plantarum]